MADSFYNIIIKDIHGSPLPLSSFKGKKVMIVNVASACGFTPQYEALESLYQNNLERLVILACPCNDFGAQEPGDENEILQFCTLNYGISFPITEKLKILDESHPLYQWLCNKSLNGVNDYEVRWNFHKFLIHEDGTLYQSLPSDTDPLDSKIVSWVQG